MWYVHVATVLGLGYKFVLVLGKYIWKQKNIINAEQYTSDFLTHHVTKLAAKLIHIVNTGFYRKFGSLLPDSWWIQLMMLFEYPR